MACCWRWCSRRSSSWRSGISSPRRRSAASPAPRWAWAGFWIAVVGTLVTTVAILSGTSTVLYTFYPPLLAHPAFYIGATLLVVGSWIWCGVMIASYRAWRRSHALERVPLAAHGMIATVAIWILATDRPRRGSGGAHPAVVARSGRAHRSDRGAHVLLVVRPPAHVLLARAGLRALVHRDPARRRRQAVQRRRHARRVRAVHPVLDAGRLPSPVHRSRHRRRLEAGAHVHDLRDHVSEPRHRVHRDRLARVRRPRARRHGPVRLDPAPAVARSVLRQRRARR